MATFGIEATEGMRWVRVDLDDDDVRTEKGALNRMRGRIQMDVPLPSLRSWWVSLFSEESLLRPRYVGTGSVFLDSTLGGFHMFRVTPEERWILDTKCFWASDGEVRLSVHRETMWTSWWADRGLFWYKTALQGDGQVVLKVDGPVQELDLVDDRLLADGPFVIARTSGIRLRMRRPARSLLSHWLSGERLALSYEGTGKILLCTTPYWRQRMQKERADPAMLG